MVLAANSIEDIKKDITELHKEHVILVLSIILIYDHTYSMIADMRSVADNVKKKNRGFPWRMQRIIHSAAYTIVTALLIITGSIYDIFQDIAEMRKEYFEFVIGIVFIFMAMRTVKEQRLKIKAVLLQERNK